jgi:hypothetical protein
MAIEKKKGMNEEERSAYLKKTTTVQKREDPVDRLVYDLTAEEFVEWLVFRGSMDTIEANVVDNLRSAFQAHRLRGRIDRYPFLIVLGELWGVWKHPKTLSYP